MAKYKVLDTTSSGSFPGYNPRSNLDRVSESETELGYKDVSYGYELELHGKFTFAFGGEFKGGKITSITFTTPDHIDFVNVTGLSLNAKQADAFLLGVTPFHDLLPLVLGGADTLLGTENRTNFLIGMGGKDRIIGGDKNDRIEGGKGNDRLTGNDGTDYFDFRTPKFGKDVITDFDANSSDGSYDYILADPNNVKVVMKSHHDTLIKFFDGSEILLLDVNHRQVTTADFSQL